MNSVLNVTNAVKSFGSTKALDDASFELREGEWLALLGPNGAGKTTIVRSIAGRVRLDSGKIMLLDEPTVGVDPQSRQRIWEMLESLRRDGASLLLTTHQLDEAQQICDRIVVIDRGKVIADGTLDELVRKTIGSRRQVAITFSTGETVRAAVSDIGEDLSKMLSEAKSSRHTVTDVHIESPTLQAVFLHLTGRELRE